VPRNEPRWRSSTTRSVEKPSLDRERLHFGKRISDFITQRLAMLNFD